MKLFCSQCAKPFSVPPADLTAAATKCPECGKEIPVPSVPVAPGVVISDFLIEKLISQGGMGEVYLAKQLSLDRPVALKVLQSKFTSDREYIDSLFHEARAAAKINHPNIVQAYAVGEEDGIFYFAMEFVRGNTFKTILKEQNGKLAFRQAAKVIREVAGALNTAWKEQKLVHQDIKPDNIMLDANGFAKLADMGLAKTAGMPQTADEDADEVFGTPQYISPEQLTGVPTDVRSDIYSLGATFFQFVTGRFPYVGTNAEDITKQHVEGKLTPPKEINPELPEELNVIILKMMARLPENRYQTPEPLMQDLDRYLQHSGDAPSPKSKIKLNLPSRPGTEKSAGALPPKPVLPSVQKSVGALPPKPVLPSVQKSVGALPPKPVSAQPAVALPAKKKENPPLEEKKNEEKNLETDAEKSPRKKHPVLVRWLLIGGGAFLLLLIIGALVTLLILESRTSTPEFLQPVAKPLYGTFSRLSGSVRKKAIELSKPTIVAEENPVPQVVKTRPEYLAKVSEILDSYAAERSNSALFLHQVDLHWREICDARTAEEKESGRQLCETFSAVDESARASLAREILRRKHLDAIAKRQEKRRLEEEKRKGLIVAAERKKEEERRQALENEEKRKKEAEYRRQQTVDLQKNLDSLRDRLISFAVSEMKKELPANWQPLMQEINNYLATAPRNNSEQREMIKRFESFRDGVPACVNDAQEKAKLLALVQESTGIRLQTSKGLAVLVSIRWGKIVCKSKNDELFDLQLKKEPRALKMLSSALVRRNVQHANFYLGLLGDAPEVIRDEDVPPVWKKCWPIFRKALK